ncbi:MAG: class I SAM-dependent methyltransferase [Ginsengibacter sp.]
MGFTASIVLKEKPKSYIGVELNEEAAENLKRKISDAGQKIITANASSVPCSDSSVDKLYGEAMLTMHADHRKIEIIREAHRLLRKGGLYAIHELGLSPDDLAEDTKNNIRRQLAETIHVNARPLTQPEWRLLLEQEGFKVKAILTNPMNLLEMKRVVDDEGFFRALKIGFNVMRYPKERKHILKMRKVFRQFSDNMNAVCIISEKI